MRAQSERAKLVSYLRVFVKFVVFLVENFIFNVSFEVCKLRMVLLRPHSFY